MTLIFPHPDASMMWKYTAFDALLLLPLALMLVLIALLSFASVGFFRAGMRTWLFPGLLAALCIVRLLFMGQWAFTPPSGYGTTPSQAKLALDHSENNPGIPILESYSQVPTAQAIASGDIDTSAKPLSTADQTQLRAAVKQHFGLIPTTANAPVSLSINNPSPLTDAEHGTTYNIKGTLENCALNATVQRDALGQITSLTASTMTCANGSAGTTLTAKG